MKRLLCVTLIWSASACYVYTPVGAPLPEMGQEIRASLTTPRTMGSGAIIIRDVTRVEGVVYRSTSDTLMIWSKWVHGDRGDRYFTDGEVHSVDRANLELLEVRQLHPGRTAVASAAAIGLGFSLYAFAVGLGGGVDGTVGPGDRQGHVVAPILFPGLATIR